MSDHSSEFNSSRANPEEPVPETRASLTSGVGRNTVINGTGFVVPIVIALATVPAYLGQIGEARYGVLSIVWVILGYFGVFDLGLGRATANRIARFRDESTAKRDSVFWSALLVNAFLGVVGGILLYVAGDGLLTLVVKESSGLQAEATGALPWLAVAVPLSTVNLVLIGALEGRERFAVINVLSVTGTIGSQLAPLGYAYLIGPSLTGLIATTTVALAVSTLLVLAVTVAALPVSTLPRIDYGEIESLFRYGGWITLTSLASILLTAVDRLVIGAVSGARDVARYTVPYTLISRVSIVPIALVRTLFPRFSMLAEAEAKHVATGALRALLFVMTPLAVGGMVVLAPFLHLWVGSDLARHATPVGVLLLVGFWVNSLAIVPFALLQAQGRPDIPAKFHLLEVPPYIVALALGVHFWGINGAALAWTARATLDAALLFRAAGLGEAAGNRLRRSLIIATALVLAAYATSASLSSYPLLRYPIGALLVLVCLAWAWRLAPSRLIERLNRGYLVQRAAAGARRAP